VVPKSDYGGTLGSIDRPVSGAPFEQELTVGK